MDLITGPIDLYDWLTFAFLIIAIVAFFSIFVFVMGLPGKIAIQRRHPHAETVKIMGWAGFLAVVPWFHAFIWAFHDSLTVDVRRFPEEEKKAIDEEIARLKGEEPPTSEPVKAEVTKVPSKPKSTKS